MEPQLRRIVPRRARCAIDTLNGWWDKLVAGEKPTQRLALLTAQPIRPKLRLSMYMPVWTVRARILVLLLGIIFLAAQFHFCADLTATSSASHFCPTCSIVGSVVTPQTLGIAIMPVMNRLELPPLVVSVFSAVPRATSPRAPPSL